MSGVNGIGEFGRGRYVLSQISITDRVQDDKSYPLCTTLLCCAISMLARFTASRTVVRDFSDALERLAQC